MDDVGRVTANVVRFSINRTYAYDPIIKASPFSTGNVPNRYVGIKKSVARTLPQIVSVNFWRLLFLNVMERREYPFGCVKFGCVELFMGHMDSPFREYSGNEKSIIL